MAGKGETYAAVKKEKARMRNKARASKAKKAAHAKSSTGKLAKNIATITKHTKKGSERAGMIKSVRQRQAKKAAQAYEG